MVPVLILENEIHGIQYFILMFNSKININNILWNTFCYRIQMEWNEPHHGANLNLQDGDRIARKLRTWLENYAKHHEKLCFLPPFKYLPRRSLNQIYEKNIQELIVMCARRKISTRILLISFSNCSSRIHKNSLCVQFQSFEIESSW